MQTMVPLYGFGGVPYSAVRKAAPRNILDNSDFRNPVNQRGQTSYTTYFGMSFDRWYIASSSQDTSVTATVSKTSNGVKVEAGSNGLVQLAQRLPAEVLSENNLYTAVMCKSDGTLVYGRIGNYLEQYGFWSVNFDLSDGDELIWAALYEGAYTAATLPEYRCKGYGAELAECRRYFRRYACIIPPHSSANDPYVFLGLETDMYGTKRDMNIGGIAGGDNVNIDYGGYQPGFSDDRKSLMFIQLGVAYNSRIVYVKDLTISADL